MFSLIHTFYFVSFCFLRQKADLRMGEGYQDGSFSNRNCFHSRQVPCPRSAESASLTSLCLSAFAHCSFGTMGLIFP